MNHYNNTNMFILLGISSISILRTWLTTALFLAYSFTMIENMVLIVLIRVNIFLQTPMYFFLCHLSFLECCYTTIVVPRTLYYLITDNNTILFPSCILQLYTFLSLGATECLLLATMAYDRYIAICYPLRYSVLMNNKLCILLAFSSWLGGFLSALLPAIFVSKLHFCSHTINHLLCDIPPILQLSCSATRHIELSVSILSSIVLFNSFIVILVSYIKIASTIFAMPSKTNFQKTFSTCASHLAVVCIYYGSGIYMYVRPNSHKTLESNKLVTLFYAVVTPMLNPIIYSFRNNDCSKGSEDISKNLTS